MTFLPRVISLHSNTHRSCIGGHISKTYGPLYHVNKRSASSPLIKILCTLQIILLADSWLTLWDKLCGFFWNCFLSNFAPLADILLKYLHRLGRLLFLIFCQAFRAQSIHWLKFSWLITFSICNLFQSILAPMLASLDAPMPKVLLMFRVRFFTITATSLCATLS